ncbi:F-box/kelch-repeat protein At3g23880 [Lactuca sativa]|uniref:F-box/kelch-repeat protein At3g23880 n=1 Tax=Lactuca sativa TaxID=4236 RepID=UPI000CACA095|nr:F-box/kelch-repeat protein At3g23880 [Lactuca sativa]
MSSQIPFHVQEEILKRLPVKSLIQFRSVCKAWRCLIDSAYFIAAHTVGKDQCQQLLIKYVVGEEARYVSIVDDDTFPQQRFVPTLPLSVKLLKRPCLVGSCNGLLCLDGYYYAPERSHSNFEKRKVLLWNPSIRKSIAIDVPVTYHVHDQTTFGFGVCPVTNDPKIVMIPQLGPMHEKKSEINNPRGVMIYTLSSGEWRSPSSNVWRKSVRVRPYGVVVDRLMYWCGSHQMERDGWVQWTSNLIMSFDLTNENFEIIDLPDSLARHPPVRLSVSKIRDSLVVIEDSFFNKEKQHCAVWMMENGAQKSFTKLFTVISQHALIMPLGFRKNGTPIMEVDEYGYEKSQIMVYDPNSQHFNDLEIFGKRYCSTVTSFMETLLLLGRSDCYSF